MIQHICIIPCRSGSKTIKDKNLLKLGSDNLIGITLKKAMDSKCFSKVILTTDYQMFKLNLDGFKSNMHTEFRYIMRPKELAQDDTLMIDVVKHVLKDIGGNEKWVWVLQPTSPFRTVAEIKKIKSIIDTGEYKSLISWKPQKEYIDRTATWKNNRAYRIAQNNFKNKQELQPQVHRSGNYYIIDREIIETYQGESDKFNWMQEPSYAYMMGEINPTDATLEQILRSRMLGTNIDDMQDYNIAKDIVRRGDFVI
jgi:CMP-N-acetylneuraminic acid synthetase